MSIFVIADLHLSFKNPKPMDIFGDNWTKHEEKIKKDWNEKVKEEDLVVLPGDFSWATYIEDTIPDFEYLNSLPGKKIMLKGNHDYWWTTLKSMRDYLKQNNYNNIDFIYNNSYEYENKIIAGTRGWNIATETEEDKKVKARELLRLENSIKDGIEKYGEDKEIIVCMHYPPIIKENTNTEYAAILQKYKVKKCIYGHLHGKTQVNAVEGIFNGVEYIMASCDYTGFKLKEIC